jgi:hypothetical protein
MSTITIRKMPIVEVDKEYKIPLKQVSDNLNIKPADRFLLRAETKEKIILEKIKHKDSLIEIIENPAHIDRERMTIDLKKLEEEMWTE